MRWRPLMWQRISLLCVAAGLSGLALLRISGEKTGLQTPPLPSRPGEILGVKAFAHSVPRAGKPTDDLHLSNTDRSLGELLGSPTAILLENASIETSLATPLDIPAALQASPEPGAYLVQLRPGAASKRFTEGTAAAVIGYIPNNSWLVQCSVAEAERIRQDSGVQAVIPYAPYFKLKSAALRLALSGAQPPAGAAVRVLVYPGREQSGMGELAKLGFAAVGVESTPFGPAFSLAPDGSAKQNSLVEIARLPFVQEVELATQKQPATDLARVALGVAQSSTCISNYLGLDGAGILVEVNDTGVDSTHPDLSGRVASDASGATSDTAGHGTQVAGVIAGSGAASTNVVGARGSVVPTSAGQFRGMAPAARILSVLSTNTDSYLQRRAALSAARISNNSWTYSGASYDLTAASYDAAVRDALPDVGGPQPVTFVFAAGNAGAGTTDGQGGWANTVLSPATAKNVITVGAVEQLRRITNEVVVCPPGGDGPCITNTVWLEMSDSEHQVAAFSSRGNVGIGLEGVAGRFKPDVVAPGTFVISPRSQQEDEQAYYSPANPELLLGTNGDSLMVLSNLNHSLGANPLLYRYESGTSLAAASVSGTLALIEQFFEQHLQHTNSPALLKALLLNGARSLGGQYDFAVQGATNAQGWGLVNLTNSLPASATNSASLLFYDQDAATALSTGESRTFYVQVQPGARSSSLRATLVWTDPPGNPVAGVKLVNDLDLVVTNLETGEVFAGNNFPPGQVFTAASNANSPGPFDRVNNVENVFLDASTTSLASAYSVTVRAYAVNVGALPAVAGAPVQDFALVLSSGDGQVTNALSATNSAPGWLVQPRVTVIPEQFGQNGGSDIGGTLTHERVGAAAPGLATKAVPYPAVNGQITSDGPLSWHFYVLTNGTDYTNAAFLTFGSRPLTPSGLLDTNLPASSDPDDADIDLYVSTDAGLTNLDPVAIQNAWKSTRRGGTETVVTSEGAAGTFYVGVKCEDHRGADYSIMGVISLLPFSTNDANGNEVLRGFPSPAPIPDATAQGPGEVHVFGVASEPAALHRVVVTNTLTHAAPAELLGTLTHGHRSAGLNTLNPNIPPGQPLIYDDSAQGDIPQAQHTDGPGSLVDFSSRQALGQWMLTESDTSAGNSGTNDALTLLLENEPDLTQGTSLAIVAGGCRDDFLYVPAQATNVAVTAGIQSGAGPLEFQLFRQSAGAMNGQMVVISNSTGVTLTADKSTFPLLNAGMYVVRLCNLGPEDVVAGLNASVSVNSTGPSHTIVSSTNFVPLIAAGVTIATNCITNTAAIVSASVGLRIDHPQISDLAVTLISPQGTQVLLQQNRGGTNSAGLGASVLMTNVVPVSSSGGADANTNTVNTGQRSGIITIDYNFYALPDDMHIYYDGNLIYDSGDVSFTGHTNIQYGPGSTTSVTIIMNEGGNPDTNTLWDYTVTSTQPGFQYATFTEDTNLTTTPIKFAIPPFNTPGVAANGRDYGIFYLPEASLARLAGENPEGIWKLEMADNGVGIPDAQPALLGWQMDFVLADTTPVPLAIPYGQALMRVLSPNQTQLFAVDVPSWAHFATNTLLNASAPVNLVFNQNGAPGFPTTSGNQIMLAGATNGQFVLSSTNGSPLLLPSSRFYLAVQNTNQLSVSFSFQEDFDVPPPPPLLIGAINVSSAGAQLEWTAAPGLSFQVQWSPSLSPPAWTTFFDVLTSGSGSYSYLDDGSQTGGLAPVRFYRVVQLP